METGSDLPSTCPPPRTSTATDFHRRGVVFDAQLEEMQAVWAGAARGTAGAIGPAVRQADGPPLLIGGMSESAVRRTVTHGAGRQLSAFADAGCDELILFPCGPDIEQLRRLADVALG